MIAVSAARLKTGELSDVPRQADQPGLLANLGLPVRELLPIDLAALAALPGSLLPVATWHETALVRDMVARGYTPQEIIRSRSGEVAEARGQTKQIAVYSDVPRRQTHPAASRIV